MAIITVYYKEDSETCLEAVAWLRKHHIPIILKNINTITSREIFQLVYLSGLDITGILIKSEQPSFLICRTKAILSKLNFSQSLSFLVKHTEFLELPIFLTNEKSLTGYTEQKIKNFLQ